MDYPIIGYFDVREEDFIGWAKQYKAPQGFLDLAKIVIDLSKKNNINPIFVYSQISWETGWYYKNGSAAGLDASYHNPCGLKIKVGGGDFDKYAHMRFKDWETGIQAQIDHALLYAGSKGYPKQNTPDPRHFPYLLGSAKTVLALSGKWAPSAKYGENVANRMTTLYKYIEEHKKDVKEDKKDIQLDIINKNKDNIYKVYVFPSNTYRTLAYELAKVMNTDAISSNMLESYIKSKDDKNIQFIRVDRLFEY